MGGVFGNIFTTFYFRIPRGIPLNGIEKPPMCSSCGARIKYPYYAPFFQFVLKGLKAACCGVQIPKIYTMIELCGAMFCLLFFIIYPISGFYIIKFLAVLVLGLITLLFFQREEVYEKLNWILLLLGIILCTDVIFPGGFNLSFLDSKLFMFINRHFVKIDDFFTFLIIFKLLFGLCVVGFFKSVSNLKNIEFICLLLCLSVALPTVEFLGSSVASLAVFNSSKKRLALLPFLISSIFII